MKPLSMAKLGIGTMALAGSVMIGAPALAQPADSSTTVIEQHRVVRAPAPTATVVQHTVTTRETATTSSGTEAAPAPRPVHRRVVRRVRHPHHPVASHTVVATDTEVSAPPPSSPTATVDRRTVIHHHADGDVSTHTRVVRQDANGDTTSVERRTRTDADDAPPPPPPPSPN